MLTLSGGFAYAGSVPVLGNFSVSGNGGIVGFGQGSGNIFQGVRFRSGSTLVTLTSVQVTLFSVGSTNTSVDLYEDGISGQPNTGAHVSFGSQLVTTNGDQTFTGLAALTPDTTYDLMVTADGLTGWNMTSPNTVPSSGTSNSGLVFQNYLAGSTLSTLSNQGSSQALRLQLNGLVGAAPEPSSLALLSAPILGFLMRRRNRSGE